MIDKQVTKNNFIDESEKQRERKKSEVFEKIEREEKVEETSDPTKLVDNSRIKLFTRKPNVYDSMDEEEESDQDESRFVIPFKSKFRSYWDSFIVFLIIYTIVILPFRIAFDIEPKEIIFILIDVLIDSAFICDFVLNFFFSYKNSNEREILSLRKTSLTYLKSWFLIDLISATPFSFISLIYQDEKEIKIDKFESFAKIARLYKLSKWVRVFRIFKIINIYIPPH